MNIVKREPVVVNPLKKHPGENRASLSGEWRFRLDPGDVGVGESWFRYPFVFQDVIEVPGSWQGQGFGGDASEPHKEIATRYKPYRATYEGAGWYMRAFTVPEAWRGKRVWLNFGGVNPTADVWLNGAKLGEHHSPLTPFAFEITGLMKIPDENLLVVRVSEEDRLMGLNYYYTGKWSGIYRDVELTATGDAYINSLRIYPEADTGRVRICADMPCAGGQTTLRVTLSDPEGSVVFAGDAPVCGGAARITAEIAKPMLWSPDSPALYEARAEAICGGCVQDAATDRFGFVILSADGARFTINREPYFMRGTGDFHEIPETVTPDTDRARWRKRLTVLREMGYNYVRCHSCVPIPEYFDIADELGLIVQSELGALGPLGGHSREHTYNMYPKPTPDYRERFRAQWNAIVARDVNHPSANLYCMSNELNFTFYPKTAWRCYNETKALKPTSLVIWTDGGRDDSLPQDFVNDWVSPETKFDKPFIEHEFKWWSSYPDVSLAEKYRRCGMRNFAAEAAIESAGRRGVTHILPEAAKNSQALQYIEAKGKMEAMRRDHPLLAGICHFNAMDTGMSPQGLIDMFYEKKHVEPAAWRNVNGDTVVLSDVNFDNRILTCGENRAFKFCISDFSHPAFSHASLHWSLDERGEVLSEGDIEFDHQPYRACGIGEIRVAVPERQSPSRMLLKAVVTDGARSVQNSWTLWAFPKSAALPEGCAVLEDARAPFDAKAVVTGALTPELAEYVARGGRAILVGSEGLYRPFIPGLMLETGRYFFTRPANFPPYEELQDGTIIQNHAIFGDFPHDGYADLQFYNMISESPALDLEGLDLDDGDPVIRMLHSYKINRCLGYLVERRLGRGLLIVTSLNISEKIPESMHLLRNMCLYALSCDSSAAREIRPGAIEKLISATNIN